jgi:hypothetical protein
MSFAFLALWFIACFSGGSSAKMVFMLDEDTPFQEYNFLAITCTFETLIGFFLQSNTEEGLARIC